jgi:hypothetical protein
MPTLQATLKASGSYSKSTQAQPAQSWRCWLVAHAPSLGCGWGSLRCAGENERASRARCGFACRPHDNWRRNETRGQPYQLRSGARPQCEEYGAVIVRRSLATIGTLHGSAVRAIARLRRSQSRDDSDDSNINGLTVLCAAHVANIGLVPKGRQLRDSNRNDQRRGEQSGRPAPFARQERRDLVHPRKHSEANSETCIGHSPDECYGRARLCFGLAPFRAGTE